VTKWPRAFRIWSAELLGRDSADGAFANARAAVDAGVGVDDVFAFAFGDAFNGADGDASAAAGTVVTDDMGHRILLGRWYGPKPLICGSPATGTADIYTVKTIDNQRPVSENLFIGQNLNRSL
jgi:hypothetical protein